MAKVRTWCLRAGALLMPLLPLLSAGCVIPAAGASLSPFSMGPLTPIPVPPWVTERMEDKYAHKNDYRTTIMPPLREGFPPPICEDPPSEQEVLRAMPRVTRGVPFVYEEFRDDIQVVNERLVDKIDPPRFYPLVGPAQLHHCHWKCTIYYRETVQSDYPFPVKVVKNRVEVVYIDKDHLHLFVGPNPATQNSVTRDLAGY
jgi:hypothetical protein